MGTDGISNNKPIIKPTAAKQAELAKEFKDINSFGNDSYISFDEFYGHKSCELGKTIKDPKQLEAEMKKAEAQFKQYAGSDGKLNIDEFTELCYFEENPENVNKKQKEFTYMTAAEKADAEEKAKFMEENGAPTGTITDPEQLEKIFELEFKWAEKKGLLKPSNNASASEIMEYADKIGQSTVIAQFPNGKVKEKQYIDEAGNRTIQKFDQAGNKIFERINKKIDGKETPVSEITYYTNGQVKSSYKLADDKITEEQFAENGFCTGKTVKTKIADGGYAVTEKVNYYDNGNIKNRYTSKDGRPNLNSSNEEFYKNGNLKTKEVVKNGIMVEKIETYPNGNIKSKVSRENGLIQEEEFYENGNPKSKEVNTSRFKGRGWLVKENTEYYENGNIKRSITRDVDDDGYFQITLERYNEDGSLVNRSVETGSSYLDKGKTGELDWFDKE